MDGMTPEIRKFVTFEEEVHIEGFEPVDEPWRMFAVAAVITNPWAGRYVDNLKPEIMAFGPVLGELLTDRIISLAGSGEAIEAYGKAAIVGVEGDLEHGGAMIHPKLGKPMRTAVGGGKALIPSNAKVASAGTCIDVPLGHKDEAWSFDHFDTMTIAIADAPRPNEIVMCMAVSDGPRPHPRCGSGPVTD